MREHLADVVNRESDLVVGCEAEDRHEPIKAILVKPTDLVVVNLTLRNSDGLELIKDIRTRWPRRLTLCLALRLRISYKLPCLAHRALNKSGESA
jgi:DNA-binding NarL/FixJ family response regulator